MPASEFDAFFEHALSVKALTEAELDSVTDDIATGCRTEESAISAYLERTQAAVWPFYKSVTWETPTEALRFVVGDRVQARIGDDDWAPGVVVNLWWRHADWPAALVAPYQIKLDGEDALIFAPVDAKSYVIASGERPPASNKIDKAMMLGYGCKSSMREWEESGYGPLHVCCMMKGDVESLRQLLRRPLPQCDPDNFHNRYGESPLCMAACYGQLHCAILLLAAGADPRLPNCYGKSPAVIAQERRGLSSKWAQEALIALLKQRAAELDAEEAALVSEAEDTEMRMSATSPGAPTTPGPAANFESPA